MEKEERGIQFGPVAVNNVLGEQKGEKLIWTAEPGKASFQKGFKQDLGGCLKS